jgi:hypothetical protein
MTKQELVDYCLDRVANIKLELLEEDREYEFYSDFFSDYSIKSVKKITEIPPTDLVTIYLNSVITDKDFEEIGEDVSSFSYLLEEFDSDDLHILNNIIELFIEDGGLDKLKHFFVESNKRRSYQILFAGEEDSLMRLIIKKMLDINNDDKADIYTFLGYYEEYPDIMTRLIEYISAIKKIRDMYTKTKIRATDMDTGKTINLKDKEYNKILEDRIKSSVNSKLVCQELTPVDQYYSRLCSNEKSRKRKLEKHEKAYTNFINSFSKIFSSTEIKDYKKIAKDIPDDDIRLEFLKLAYEHNMEEYEKTLLSYNELAKNSSVRYLVLLQDNDISKDEIRLSSVMKNTYDDVVSMLKILKGMFDDKKIIIKALEMAKKEDILYLKELMDKGVISKDTVIKYSSIFSGESYIREALDENIKTLNNFGLNPSILVLNPEVLFDNELLKENLNVLKEYDLIKYLKGQNNYSFLGSRGLIVRIDKMLELGYEKYLKEDITLLNEDNIDRVYVLKSIGFMPNDKDELIDCLRSDKFLVSSNQMSDYIENVVEYVKDEFRLDIDAIISEYNNTNRTVSINGIILSKNRIIRNKDLGNFKSIITGSILSKDEIDRLKSELKKKELIKNS